MLSFLCSMAFFTMLSACFGFIDNATLVYSVAKVALDRWNEKPCITATPRDSPCFRRSFIATLIAGEVSVPLLAYEFPRLVKNNKSLCSCFAKISLFARRMQLAYVVRVFNSCSGISISPEIWYFVRTGGDAVGPTAIKNVLSRTGCLVAIVIFLIFRSQIV